MANSSMAALRGGCPAPFFSSATFPISGGYIDGRLCSPFGQLECCMPCPLVDYVYPDAFGTLTVAASWISVASSAAAAFLLLSWAFLPVDRTHRHYLSISLTAGVLLMNFGFVIPLAAKPAQCHDAITPNGMASSSVCAASGALLLLGGWAGVMWVFLRSVSLHLQICWQLTVGRNFMLLAHVAGWGLPLAALAVALVFSGVSFRFGPTCHINHANSLAAFWVPLFVFAGLSAVITFATFGYCVRVYLASLTDHSAGTAGTAATATDRSGLPSYSYQAGSSAGGTLSPRQAYRRVRRVVSLQWRGILIVLIILADVVFFSVVFVFQDSAIRQAQVDATKAREWVLCLVVGGGDKDRCLVEAEELVIGMATVVSVLFLLALNGIWLLFLLGRKDMALAWLDLVRRPFAKRKEFVSVDARGSDVQKDKRSYEMLSKDSGAGVGVGVAVTPPIPVKSPAGSSPASHAGGGGHHSEPADHFFNRPPSALPYQPSDQSFSGPRPPRGAGGSNTTRAIKPLTTTMKPMTTVRSSSPAPESVSPAAASASSALYPPASSSSSSSLSSWGQPLPPEPGDRRPWGMGMNAV